MVSFDAIISAHGKVSNNFTRSLVVNCTHFTASTHSNILLSSSFDLERKSLRIICHPVLSVF
jgi:hypothetical protein